MSLDPERNVGRPRRRLLKDGPKYTNTMFQAPKYKELADIISLSSYDEAKEASRKLLSLYKKSDRAYKTAIKRATVLAANRASILARRVYNPYRQDELKRINQLYKDTYNKMIIPKEKKK